MPIQYQENTSSKNKLVYDSSTMVKKSYPIVDPALLHQKGQLVTLTATGEVQPAVAGDFPLGWVTVANIVNDPSGPIHHQGYVTVHEVSEEHNFGFAKGGAIATGALVQADGQSTVDAEFMDYIAATGGVYAAGIVISGAAAGEQMEVALFNSPIYVA